MNVNQEKWPKVFPELTAEQEWISNDFMKYWHTILPKKYKMIERFNHGYAVKNAPANFIKTIEIGAGLGEHVAYEVLTNEQRSNYVAFELRENMANKIRRKDLGIKVWNGDCQVNIPVSDNEFDRVIAIHVLEHLKNLPEAIKEIYRVTNKQQGILSIVIPCEGGLFYNLARKFSAQRIFERRYKKPYQWFIEREHVNRPTEILEEILFYFSLESRHFFPFKFLPYIGCNLCIGLTCKPKKKAELIVN